MLIGVVSAVDIASDGFESNSFSGGYGWSGDWVVGGQQAYPWYFPHTGTFGAFVNGLSSITRETDTSGYSDVTLGFWLRTVSPPVTVSYVVGGLETDLVTVSSVTPYTYYEYDLPSDVVSIKFNNDAYSSSSYVDDVLITGEVGVESEVILSIDDNYVLGRNAQISLSSTETDALHKLELSYPNGTLFCEKTLLSPSVSQTSFSTICELPEEQVIDAKAYFYVTNDESINTTKFFNIVNLDNNPTMLNIEEVYFSAQVLQGSSTEIFAIIDTALTIDTIVVELTFPDGQKRILPMYATPNPNEYRAFITDTYRVGNTSFKIIVEEQDYYDEYENQYEVAAYNVDFVDAVNNVNEILSQPPTIDVLGTYYEVGDVAKVIAQLSTSGLAINNATCYASIYYPDNSLYLRNTIMEYVDNSDGLYVYDMTIPNVTGVYPLSVVCDYITTDVTYYVMDASYEYGTSSSGGGTEIWFDDDVYSNYSSGELGDNQVWSVNLTYMDVNISDATRDFYVEWQGFTDMPSGGEGFFYLYNYNTSTFDQTINSITSGITSVSFTVEDDIENYINNGNLTLKFNGSIETELTQETLFSDDFEDGNLNGWTQNSITGSPTFFLEDEISGDFAAGIEGSGGQGTTETGALEYYLDTTGYTDITFSYDRKSEGAESNDDFAVEVTNDGGSTWDILESWSGNSGLSSESYTLDSSYVTSDFGIRFYASTQRNNDELFFDNVEVVGESENNYIIYTDFLTLHVVEAAGVVNEVRGGGEFNVKDRLAGIEDTLDDIAGSIGVVTDDVFNVQYSMPKIYSQQDNPLLAVYAQKDGEAVVGATCDTTIFGPANTTGIGPEQISSFPLTELGGGIYYNVFTNPLGWQNGIYTIETNCVDGVLDGYSIDGFRMEADYELYLQEINTTVVTIEGFNVTLQNVLNQTSSSNTEIPIVLIGGTEYVSDEEGLVAVRLTKAVGSSQSLITGATCSADILYPNQTSFVSSASMTEYGSGIYYYNFTVPSTNGVYIYSVDCADGSKDYYAMNTFHVSSFYNWSVDLTSVLAYLDDINNTVTTIDGRTINMYSVINDSNNRLILLNGTIYDMYDLMIVMNNTINNIYSLAQSINATVIDIQGTVNDIEVVVLDINGTVYRIEDNTIEINESLNNVHAKLDSMNLTIEEILDYVIDINNTVNVIDGKVDIIDGKIDILNGTVNNIEYIVTNINGTVNSIQIDLYDINSTIVDMYAFLAAFNASTDAYFQNITSTQTQHAHQLSDIYDLLVVVNSTQVNYSSELASILAYLEDINDTQVNYSQELSDIYNLIVTVNGTVNQIEQDIFYLNGSINTIDGKVDQVLANQAVINGTVNGIENTVISINTTTNYISSVVDDIKNATITIQGDLITINGTVNGIEDIVITINGTVNYVESRVDDIYALLQLVNATQTNHTQDLIDIYNAAISTNSSVTSVYNLLTITNTTVNDIYDLLSLMNASQYNNTQSLSDIYALLQIVNFTQVNYSSELSQLLDYASQTNQTVTDIYALNVVMNSSLNELLSVAYATNSTVNDIYNLNIVMNSTLNSHTTTLNDIYSLLQIVNSTQCNCSDLSSSLSQLIDITTSTNTTVNDVYALLQIVNSTQVNYSSELNAILDYADDINITTTDIYTLLQIVNSTQFNYSSELFQILDYVNDINETVTGVYAVSVATNTTVNDIWALNQNMNFSLNQIYALDVLMNGTLNSIVSSLNDMNLTLIDIYDQTITITNNQIVINGTVNDIENIVITINGTVNSIETKVDTALTYLIDINGTVTSIEDGVLEINTTTHDIYDLLSAMNENVTNIYGLSININDSLYDMNLTLENCSDVLDQVHSLSLQINDTTIDIYDIVTNISYDLSSLSNLTIYLNTTLANHLTEILLIQEQINNLTIYLADISYFNSSINASDYYNESSLETPIILETQLLEFGINIIQDPIEGSTYRLNYFFFDSEGVLVKEELQEVTGLGDKSIYISSNDIDVNAEEEYEVWLRVEMLNGAGFWQSFPLEHVDTLTIQPLTSNALKGPGLYDVIVGNEYDVYEESEKIEVGIIIKNTGDSPDEDTILTYWLESPDGTRYGETREQFLEVPVGTTYLERALSIPLGVSDGEWQVKAQYETVVQPTIEVYDAFEVRDLSFWEKIRLRAPRWVQLNWFFSIILFILLLGFIVFMAALLGTKEKKKRKLKERDVYVKRKKE